MNENVSGWRLIARSIGKALRPRRATPAVPRSGDYPGDFRGRFTISYDPRPDDAADPGEVVWTWVPFEEDHTKGKDRPVVIVGRDHPWLLGVAMTSKDHDLDADQEAREGRYWVDIGSGSWDRSGRPSEVRVNRIIRIDPASVRRISSRLDRSRFEAVAAGILAHFPQQ